MPKDGTRIPESLAFGDVSNELHGFSQEENKGCETVALKLYHGSDRPRQIEDIIIPGPRMTCDFGEGFYLTESLRVAEEWVAREPTPVLNIYDFSASRKEMLYLTGEAWLRVVVGFRTGKYRVFLKSHIIRGIIANDRMDISLPFFLRGEIGDQRLFRCLDYCKLGNQYLLRQTVKHLSNHTFKTLKGTELQQAQERKAARRRGMEAGLQKIRRQPVPGEKYIDDYLACGDFHEI